MPGVGLQLLQKEICPGRSTPRGYNEGKKKTQESQRGIWNSQARDLLLSYTGTLPESSHNKLGFLRAFFPCENSPLVHVYNSNFNF